MHIIPDNNSTQVTYVRNNTKYPREPFARGHRYIILFFNFTLTAGGLGYCANCANAGGFQNLQRLASQLRCYNDLGMQRFVHRTLIGNFQQTLLLGIIQRAEQLQLALEVIHSSAF